MSTDLPEKIDSAEFYAELLDGAYYDAEDTYTAFRSACMTMLNMKYMMGAPNFCMRMWKFLSKCQRDMWIEVCDMSKHPDESQLVASDGFIADSLLLMSEKNFYFGFITEKQWTHETFSQSRMTAAEANYKAFTFYFKRFLDICYFTKSRNGRGIYHDLMPNWDDLPSEQKNIWYYLSDEDSCYMKGSDEAIRDCLYQLGSSFLQFGLIKQ